jgi:hypothetical protein
MGQKSNNPKKIKLDFVKKTFTKDFVSDLKTINKGEFYQIIVSNINQNLWNVSIESQDSFVISNVNFPTFSSLGIDGFNALISGIKTFANASITKLESEVDIINKHVEALNAHMYSSNQFEQLSKLRDLIIKEKKSEKNILLEEINASTDILKVRITTAKDSLILPLDSILLDMNFFKLKYLSLQNDLFKNLDPKIDLSKLYGVIAAYRTKLNNGKKSFSAIRSDLDKFIASKPNGIQLMKNDSTLRVAYKELDDKITNAIALLDKALEQINQEKIFAFMQSIVHLENNKGTTWTSLPIQYLGDVGKFEITVSPKSADFGLPSYKQEYVFQLHNTFTGVSTGFYLGFGKNNERYSILETKNSSNTSEFEIIKENDEIAEIGLTTLLHYGKKFDDCQNVGYHMSVGPAISLTAVIKPRLCIGGGLNFGKYKNMLSVDILLMTGYFDIKSNNYNEGQKYSAKPEQVTISNLGSMFGLSIGYIYKF